MAEDLSEIKRVLRSAYWIQKRLDADLEHLARLRAKAGEMGVRYDKQRVSSDEHNGLEDAVCAIVDCEKKIETQIAKWKVALERVTGIIYGVKDQRYQVLLLYRYRDFLSWERIAVEMGYSWAHIHRMHAEALKEANVVWRKIK